jgi:hypothetical protein
MIQTCPCPCPDCSGSSLVAGMSERRNSAESERDSAEFEHPNSAECSSERSVRSHGRIRARAGAGARAGLVTRCVATALAICLACQPAWGHTFPAVRTVVVQVEGCEVAVLVGYRPASGEATDTLLARIAVEPTTQQLATAKGVMGSEALAPLTFALDGKPLSPTSVRAKIGVDPGGTRPMVVVLVIYSVPRGGKLTVASREPRTTQISWTDRASGRIDPDHNPGQAKWFTGVASFLLMLSPPPGVAACVATSKSSESSQ